MGTSVDFASGAIDPTHVAPLQSNMGSLMNILPVCFYSHPKDFAIQEELAEIFIVQCNFTGDMEA